MKSKGLSVFVDLHGLLHVRRRFIGVLNNDAPEVAADLAAAVFPYYKEHAISIEPDQAVVTAERFKHFPRYQELLRQWAARHHLTHRGETPEWLSECVRRTLQFWSERGVLEKLVAPDEIRSDVDRLAELNSLTSIALNRASERLQGLAKNVVSGALNEEDYTRLIGQIPEEEFRQEVKRLRWELFESPEAKEIDEAFADMGVPPTRLTDIDLRLDFSEVQIIWAVRYQVLGKEFEELAHRNQDSTAIRKVVQKVLESVGITPRRRPGRPLGTTKKSARKPMKRGRLSRK
jgi:hypothetical protein